MLGTLEAGERQLVLADIPGLIEGASEGAGLGHEFLAHVERCRLLVHVLDLQPLDGSDPVDNHATVEAELREHGHGLAALPRLVCLSKSDLLPDERVVEAAVEEWRERTGAEVLATSAATGAGLDELAGAIARRVPMDEEAALTGRGRRAAGHPPGLPARRGRRDPRRAHRVGGLRGARASGPSG